MDLSKEERIVSRVFFLIGGGRFTAVGFIRGKIKFDETRVYPQKAELIGGVIKKTKHVIRCQKHVMNCRFKTL